MFTVAIVTGNDHHNKLKAEIMPFWIKFGALGDRFLAHSSQRLNEP